MAVTEQGGGGQTALDDLRAGLHGMWASVAPGWRVHAALVDETSTPITSRMLELADLRPGDRVLELACGPGGAGLAAARRIEPGGEVVMSDIAPEMTAIAAARAKEQGVGNVSTLELDLEQISQPDGSYDAVLCREGLMLVPDPDRAAAEIARVLRPGGRVAVAVWGPRSSNPWLGIILDAVSAQLGTPVPPPGIPGPFSLDDAGRVERLFVEAGFSEVVVDEVHLAHRAASFEEWWAARSALAGPLAKMLAALSADVVGAIKSRAREALAPFEIPGGVELPGVSFVAGARR
jgi:SAM-dependent methyltransferase